MKTTLPLAFSSEKQNQFYELPLNSCQAIEKAVAKWKDGSAKGWLGLSGMRHTQGISWI